MGVNLLGSVQRADEGKREQLRLGRRLVFDAPQRVQRGEVVGGRRVLAAREQQRAPLVDDGVERAGARAFETEVAAAALSA